MKKIYILVFIYYSLAINSQELESEYAYLIKTEISGYLHANHGAVSVRTDIGFNGSNSYMANIGTDGKVYFDFVKLQSNFSVVTIDIDNYAIGLGRNSSWEDCEYEKELTIKKKDFNVRGFVRYGGCSFIQTLYPIHVKGTDNFAPLCIKDKISLTGGYDWEYKIGNNEWKSLAKSSPSVDINIEELYSGITIMSNNDTNRSLKIKTGYNGQYTGTVTYTVIDCSPKFVGYQEINKPTCSYKNDGNFSIKLDRNLNNEKLVVSLYNDDDIIIGQEVTEALTQLDTTSYMFTWQGANLSPGRYYLKYQTLNMSDAPPSINDPSWDSLAATPEFEISPTVPLDFKVSKTDKTCFENNDGKIRIYNVTSENGRSYLFKIFKIDNNGNITVQQDWTSFTGNETTISGLQKNKYQIQVKDNKGCFAKN